LRLPLAYDDGCDDVCKANIAETNKCIAWQTLSICSFLWQPCLKANMLLLSQAGDEEKRKQLSSSSSCQAFLKKTDQKRKEGKEEVIHSFKKA